MSATCHRCGAFDPAGTKFRSERIPFRGTRVYCPKCHARLEERFLLAIQFLNVSFGLIGVVCLWLDPRSLVGHVFVNVFLVQIIALPSIIVHEFAHAFVGKMVGLSVLRIWIGRGKTFYRSNIFGFETEFKPLPLGGLTFLTHDLKYRLRLRYFLAILAGPVANLLILLVASRFVSWKRFNLESSLLTGQIIFLAQIFILVENLLPYRIQTALGTLCTDGLSLFQLLFSKSPEMFRLRLQQQDGSGATYTRTSTS